MVDLTPASAAETQAWQVKWLDRQRQWRNALGHTTADTTAWLDRCVARRTSATAAFVVHDGGRQVGLVAMSRLDGDRWELDDLWIEPAHRRRGHGAATRIAAEQWCRQQNATTLLVTIADDPVQAALFSGYHLRSQHMARAVPVRPVLAEGLTGAPLTGAAFVDWRRYSIASYARSMAAVGVEDAEERAAEQFHQLLPDGERTAHHSLRTLNAAGETVATVWLMHHWAEARSYVYDIAVDVGHRGRGYGKAAMRLGGQLAYDAGDRVMELNVFGDNATAIGLYDSLGYAVTEQYRALDLAAGG